jgi:hypothetical protein
VLFVSFLLLSHPVLITPSLPHSQYSHQLPITLQLTIFPILTDIPHSVDKIRWVILPLAPPRLPHSAACALPRTVTSLDPPSLPDVARSLIIWTVYKHICPLGIPHVPIVTTFSPPTSWISTRPPPQQPLLPLPL